MSSLGLPGPFNRPPGDAGLHRSWNAFLDKHNLRSVWQTTRADINDLCNTALLALQVSRSQQIALEDSILDLWDHMGLTVDCLNPDANLLWRADEKLVRPVALRLQEQRQRLQVQMDMCQTEAHWDPVWLELDMSTSPPTVSSSERPSSPTAALSGGDTSLNKPEAGKGDGEESKILRVAQTLAYTRYFLGHAAGDPIFSYDGRNFAYRGRVPHDPREDVMRLQILLPKVLAQLVTLIAFSPSSSSSTLDFPAECMELLNRVDDPSDELLLRICTLWMLKFGGGFPATYARFLDSSPVVREFAWLVWAMYNDAHGLWARDTARNCEGLIETLKPLFRILSFNRCPVPVSPGAVLNNLARLHQMEDEMEARELVFEQKEYNVALVYDASICPSIHGLYAHYTGRHHPDAGTIFLRTTPRQLSLENDYHDVFANVPIPDEVIAAHHRIKLRYLDEPEPEAQHTPPIDHPVVIKDDIQAEIVVAQSKRKKRHQQQCIQKNETPRVADPEPPLKKRRGRPPKHRPTPPTSDPVHD
ncbi:hypothetical protein COL5a_001847 [Colletotrichum fioriniae]|uniref:uncharacterized protein n=1 Tax=Colletotrichum fioriniae TaxID=710243 RepID=UPI0023012F5E|nr:uncharacterized protein COL516b_001236 [Colletotrichum fioriniae]KAJ0312164.1 hypothetical protein COL516b_001236 [Colletotrichum fioriniae]KAJ0332143.1 hypothetical protein COL5a_001847 [Colletotrichum fioriniae]KAJ3945889.1 hypothetical protein N0V96_004237 [Colletotrichum fioriniae]